jgi:Zn-dependent protease
MFSFRIGPFPVRVYAWFFLTAAVLGQGYGFGWRMAAWIFVVFVSVLCHELGHAVVGRAFGGHPEIHLQAFGGVTFPQFRKSPGPGRQFVLSVAGPLFGLFLGAVAFGLVSFFPPARGSPTEWTMGQFMWISVAWAIFNLLPILPLDGGQMMLAAIEGVRRKPSVALASWISVAFSVVAAAAVWLLLSFQPFLLLFLGLFAYQNVQRARLAGRADSAVPQSASGDAIEATRIESATAEVRSLLQSGQHDAALAVAARLEGAVELRGAPPARGHRALARRQRGGRALRRPELFRLAHARRRGGGRAREPAPGPAGSGPQLAAPRRGGRSHAGRGPQRSGARCAGLIRQPGSGVRLPILPLKKS